MEKEPRERPTASKDPFRELTQSAYALKANFCNAVDAHLSGNPTLKEQFVAKWIELTNIMLDANIQYKKTNRIDETQTSHGQHDN